MARRATLAETVGGTVTGVEPGRRREPGRHYRLMLETDTAQARATDRTAGMVKASVGPARAHVTVLGGSRRRRGRGNDPAGV